ncbi:MAG: alpha/beta fold hydrolase [Candidatus Heimdallarchaeota archaeon]|nr:alpha/beta fold hydrolase [Candidatus Heimdallarchaeota archaeon]
MGLVEIKVFFIRYLNVRKIEMLVLLTSLLFLLLLYFLITLLIVLIFANFPRNSMNDVPEWGFVTEYRIPTVKGKSLEAWVVIPNLNSLDPSKPAIVLLHGWGRNRGRMVSRARIFGNKGYKTILFSARDHGSSDKERLGMTIVRFSHDLESCVNWWSKPVVLDGHSIGGGACLLVAARNPLVVGVIGESVPLSIPGSLKYIYRPVMKWFTPLFLPGIRVITSIKFRKYNKSHYSPQDAAYLIKVPTLLIHGKSDELFPYTDTEILAKSIKKSHLWLPQNVNHYNIEEHPEYSNRVLNFLELIK